MKLNGKAHCFFMGSDTLTQSMAQTTHLCIAAHQDDVEIMAGGQIVECFRSPHKHFSAIVVTDGAGSPRTGVYGDYTDQEMVKVRQREQETAATIGEYSSLIQLCYPSKAVKSGDEQLIADLITLMSIMQPEVLFTHNLADKHDTHLAVACNVIKAVRALPPVLRPKKIYGMEVWRGLDWLPDHLKVVFDTSQRPHLQQALLGVFDSQIAGGKGYDSGVMGRRLANATFLASHQTDDCTACNYAMDLTEMVNSELSPLDFLHGLIEDFRQSLERQLSAFL